MANKVKKAVQAVQAVVKEGLAKVGRLASSKVPQTELERRQSSQYAAMRAQLSPTFQNKREPAIQTAQVEAYVNYVTNLASPYVKARFASKIAQTLAAIQAGQIIGSKGYKPAKPAKPAKR